MTSKKSHESRGNLAETKKGDMTCANETRRRREGGRRLYRNTKGPTWEATSRIRAFSIKTPTSYLPEEKLKRPSGGKEGVGNLQKKGKEGGLNVANIGREKGRGLNFTSQFGGVPRDSRD